MKALAGVLGINGIGRSYYGMILGNKVQRHFVEGSFDSKINDGTASILRLLLSDFILWNNKRGSVETRPGEAYKLPVAKLGAEWKSFAPQCDDE